MEQEMTQEEQAKPVLEASDSSNNENKNMKMSSEDLAGIGYILEGIATHQISHDVQKAVFSQKITRYKPKPDAGRNG